MPLQVRLLGAQSVVDAGSGEVRGRSSRAVELIAALVLEAGTALNRQRVAGLLWPQSAGAQPLTNLRRELHAARRMLAGSDCLGVTARDLWWRDREDVVVDLRTFVLAAGRSAAASERDDAAAALTHAQAALEAYRGELLPGCYEDWVAAPRDALQQRCAQLCRLVCEGLAARGDLAGALQAARRWVALEALEESGYRALMRLQAEQGDRAAAVNTYHRVAALLERELGVEPDASTSALLQQILSDRAAASASPAASGSPAAPAAPTGGSTALVGRASELDQLLGAWRSAGAGRAGILVVSGAAGIGKTRLVDALAERARRDAVVVSSQCFADSGRLALAPVADWLRTDAVRSAYGELDPVWREEVERLVPQSRGEGRVEATRALTDAWQRRRFYEGVARALVAVHRPTLAVLDNVQWCDRETLTFLGYLLQLCPDAPLLVVATLRTGDGGSGPEVGEWLATTRSTGLLTELALQPLDAPETARLAEAIAGHAYGEQDRVLLHAATGGFPLHVVEAVRTQGRAAAPTQPSGPQLPAADLDHVLRSRLEQAGPAAREIAGLAAAVGRDVGLDLLVEASDLEADTVVRAVDELWRARILQERAGTYDFCHDLLRDAAYAQVSPPRRWLLHRRIAQGMELLHAEDTDPVSAQLAAQYARGGRPQRAVDYYLRAAELAASFFGLDEAIRLHTEALTLLREQPPSRNRDVRELAVLESLAAPLNARRGYASRDLQEVLERAVELAESLGRRDSIIGALVGLFASRFVQGRVADAHRMAERALALLGPDSEFAGAAHFACAGSALSLGRPWEALDHFTIAASLHGTVSVSVGTRPDVHGPAWAAHAHWLLGRPDLATQTSDEVVAYARTLNHPYSLAVALAYSGMTRQLCDDPDGLAAAVAELQAVCERYDFGYYREWAVVLDAWLRGGEDGVTQARRGIAALRAEGAFTRMPYWLALLADLLARTGDGGGARSTLDAAIASAQARADVWWLPEVQRMRARYEDGEAAVARLESAAALARAHGSVALLERCARDLTARSPVPRSLEEPARAPFAERP